MTTNSSYILLVDDEPYNLFLLEELLQDEGYQTRAATSGLEALQIARAVQPQLILMDVMMPGMDGFETCQQLRSDPVLQTVPIIFLTALADDESRLKGLEVMGDDYLTKPIQIDLVLTKVASVLRLAELRKASHQRELAQQAQHLQQEAQAKSKQQMMAVWQINEALLEKFRLFVPDQFLSRIAPQGMESIQLGNATESEMTILFCDIREFTAIAESQQAQATFAWLNAFFTAMNRAITQHFGFIDKYLGDAVMAVFDRPQWHAMDALQAAVAMRQSLAQFNQHRQQFQLQHPVNIGIGLHTGSGLIGTVGSQERMDTTVIGDVVNTASRLEELTKRYGCPVIASGQVIEKLRSSHAFHLRWIDQAVLRGKQQPCDLYEVLGTTTYAIDEAKVRSQALFQEGIAAWQQQEFTAALPAFQAILEMNPGDTVAALYRDRCQHQLQPQSMVYLSTTSGLRIDGV